ncbi:unnamed protein product [Haemonchus placei]|uniref:Reverse transcriptase domain-containing protein n=1 Tax=Haemonchus placei TaxID=6290 RepID=A0A0N4X778_HAEPC|nr:unnamed protein product [Haemonchus placei]
MSESPSQVGSLRNYSTLNHINVLKQITEKSAEYNFPVYVALIDYKKAFDGWSGPQCGQHLQKGMFIHN